MTNFEKIKIDMQSMTVDDFLDIFYNCHKMNRGWNINCFDDDYLSCKGCIKKWLESKTK